MQTTFRLEKQYNMSLSQSDNDDVSEKLKIRIHDTCEGSSVLVHSNNMFLSSKLLLGLANSVLFKTKGRFWKITIFLSLSSRVSCLLIFFFCKTKPQMWKIVLPRLGTFSPLSPLAKLHSAPHLATQI